MASQPPEIAQRLLGNGKGWGALYLAAVLVLTSGVNWWFNAEAERQITAMETQIRRETELALETLRLRLGTLNDLINSHNTADEQDFRLMQRELGNKVDQATRLEMKAAIERRIERLEDRVERLETRLYMPSLP